MGKVETIDIERAIGKRLLHVIPSHSGSQWFLVFEDGLNVQIGAVNGWDGDTAELEWDGDFHVMEYPERLLMEAGVIDAAWIQERVNEHNERTRRDREFNEKRDRATYESLRDRFERKEFHHSDGDLEPEDGVERFEKADD